MSYVWAEGREHSVSAEAVGRVVERIEQKKGACSPDDFVAAARDPKEPAHSLLEWDDQACGEQWRREQARRIIRSLRIVRDDEAPRVAFVHVKLEKVEGYADSMRAMSQVATRDYVIMEAKAQLRGWVERNRHLDELRRLVTTVERELKAA